MILYFSYFVIKKFGENNVAVSYIKCIYFYNENIKKKKN